MGAIDLNTLSLETIQKYGASLCVDTSDPACQMVPNTWAPIQPATNANYGSSTVPLWVSLQKYPQFGGGNYGSGNGVLVNGDPDRRLRLQLAAGQTAEAARRTTSPLSAALPGPS